MLTYKHDDVNFTIRYRSWILPAALMLLPPAMLYELGPSVLDGSIERGELAGLILGLVLPTLALYFMLEFASFRFSREDGVFAWRWHNLIRRKSGRVPLERVARVRRDSLEGSDGGGTRHLYRLIVVLDDGTVVPLSRGFSGLHDRLLDRIVRQLRDFLGHASRMP